jgi:hypothetical protein
LTAFALGNPTRKTKLAGWRAHYGLENRFKQQQYVQSRFGALLHQHDVCATDAVMQIIIKHFAESVGLVNTPEQGRCSENRH